MVAATRKTVASATSSSGDRRYPPEAYNYNDDVTPEAVDFMRKKAAKVMATDEWEVVDGFGLAQPS